MLARRKRNKREEEENNKKGKKKSGILKKILILLIIVLIGVAGFITYRTKQNGGGMQGLLSTIVGHDEETLKNLDPIQILLMGYSNDNGLKLTDTIIVGSYNPKTQKASLLSIPRDTFVGKNLKTGTGNDKINAIYQKSPEKALEKVNEITGLDIKYYMVINNQALIELVDVIEGVEFYVPMRMKYTDTSQDLYIDLQEGLQTLNGDKAEQLLRFRHGDNGETYPEEYGDNDLGRMKTQRNFMIETVKQTIRAKNVFKIKDIIDIAYEYVETNISVSTIKDYVPYAINVDISAIESRVLPGVPVGPPTAPYWFYQVNKKETAALIEELYSTEENIDGENTNTDSSNEASSDVNSTSDATTNTNDSTSSETNTTTSSNNASSTGGEITKTEASKIKIEILNGSGSSKTLTEVKKVLTSKGYKIAKTSNTTSTSKTTIINKTDVDSKFENNIKELLGLGNISNSSVSSSNVDITIIIGKDYK